MSTPVILADRFPSSTCDTPTSTCHVIIARAYTLFGASYASGRSQAEYLRSHEQLNGSGTAQYAPAAYRADCVTVSRATQSQAPLHVTTALLLGESGGTIVLWDTNTAAVVRVPESSVIMRSCP
jgi:hypothetical protein